MNNDMTKGNVSKTLLYFTVPLIISGLLQQLYQIADSVIVGNFIGEGALAAVGASAPVLNVFIFVITGLVSGYTILLSQYYGAKEYGKISRLSSTFILFVMSFSCILSLLGFVFNGYVLKLLNTPELILKSSGDYLAIIFVGVPFIMLYNLLGSVLRGIGDSKTPLYGIVISSAINIALDLIFVNVFFWGVKGAAFATVIAQVLSCAYLFVYIYKKHPMFRLSFRRDMIDIPLFYESIRLGMPRVIQSSIGSVGSLLLQNIMNSFGINVVTAITTAYKIDTLTILPLINISVAISIFVGQNVGAGNMARAKEGLKKGIIITLFVAVAVTSVVVLGGEVFMKFFGVSDKVAGLGGRFFRTCGIFYPILGIQCAYSAFLQGNKDVTFTSVINIMSLAVRVILSYVLAGIIGFDIIAISEMCSWVFGAILSYARYRSLKWTKYGTLT